MRPLIVRLATTAALLFAGSTMVRAATFTVDTTTDDPAKTACVDATPDDCSLRGALTAANALAEVSTINVPAGTYELTQIGNCTRKLPDGATQPLSLVPLCLTGQVTVQGAGAATTIIDGKGAHRDLFVSFGAAAELRGVTLTNGIGEPLPEGGGADGGNIRNLGTLRLTDSVVSNGRLPIGFGGAGGPGIYNAGTLTLLRSSVTANIAQAAGGGGGILNDGFQNAVLSVFDSIISKNSIGGVGAGILNDVGGKVTVTGSTIAGNRVGLTGQGGGIYNNGTLTLINVTISGNDSSSGGGGISNDQLGVADLNNVTIANNTSEAARGGGVATRSSTFTLRNTIIAGNFDLGNGTAHPDCDAPDSFGWPLVSEGYNLIGDATGCSITGDLTGNLTGQDPKLGALTDNGGFTQTDGLIDGSPAIDAGNPAAPGSGGAACAASDQRGVLRPLGKACDIGAFERSSAFSVTGIVPHSGGNNGSIIVAVSGGGFAPGATVALHRAGHADIAGTPVATEAAGAAVTAAFDLTGAELGSWDVMVTNPDLASATLPGGFTVETPRTADLFAVIVSGTRGVRPGQPTRFAVLYGNNGNTDALGVPLTLELPASFARGFPIPVSAPPAQPGQPFDDYSGVPLEVGVSAPSAQIDIPLLIPIVPAGSTGLLSFTLTAPPGPEGTEFTISALIGTPWFANGIVRPDVVAEAATRARRMAAARLGVTAGPTLDPALIAYESAALDLTVASSRAELVDNYGQARRVFSVAYFAIDLAGYVAAQTMASAAPPSATWFAALLRRLESSFALVARPVEAQIICPPCECDRVVEGCSTCSATVCAQRKAAADALKPKKPPPAGLTPAECEDQPKHIVSADGTMCKPDGSHPCPLVLGSVSSSDPFCRTYPIIVSLDPNDKTGSGGSGPDHFVASGTPMPYVIAFENLAAATAPAQTVVVTDQLDVGVFDLESFTLGPILIGDIGITPPLGLTTFSGGADLRPALAVVVRVDAALDHATGVVTWRFTSLDPTTLEALTDPAEGFLPPNTSPPAGDAEVHFTILPKVGLTTGAEIRNHARVIFDTNAPIDTPEWLNTVDADPPVSHVDAVDAPACDSPNLTVHWSGTDVGSGIQSYTIFVSANGGPFSPFLVATSDTSAPFTGQLGTTYAFYSVARDFAGNVEGAPATPDVVHTIGCEPPSTSTTVTPTTTSTSTSTTSSTSTTMASTTTTLPACATARDCLGALKGSIVCPEGLDPKLGTFITHKVHAAITRLDRAASKPKKAARLTHQARTLIQSIDNKAAAFAKRKKTPISAACEQSVGQAVAPVLGALDAGRL